MSATLHRYWNSIAPRKVARLTPIGCLTAVAILIAGCGGASTGSGSGSRARTLLSETFSGRHTVDSGQLSASLTITPHGSTLVSEPVSISFGGPFQSRGKGQLPESDFHISIEYAGHTGSISIISTGTQGFVTLQGTAYALPAADFKQLESSFASVGGGSSASGSTLSRLGIHPQNWLADPEVLGTAEVGGAPTDHIHGRLALGPLLSDVSKILAKAATLSSSTSGLKSITPAQQAKIRGEVSGTSFDLWTGTSDHTIRRLSVGADLPVHGSASTRLGGLSSAGLALSFGYSDVGAHQTITAPSSAKPYSQFEQRFSAVILEIEELALSTASGSSSAGTTTNSSANSAYTQCVTAAGGNVSQLQKCASLLNGG